MYSQFNEEEIILEYFGDYKGFLVDIGANDGFRLSNSRRLLLDGWSGLLIEPQPEAFFKCNELYSHREDIEVFCGAVSAESGELDFFGDEGDFYGSLDEEAVKVWNKPYKKTKVQSYSWADIQPDYAIDFLSIDTEETDWDILQQIDISDIKLICFEKGSKVREMVKYCEIFRKRKIGETPVNLLYGE